MPTEDEVATLINKGLETAIANRTVTYDFADAVIANM
jgi:isocitrate dehydrogenase